MIPNPKMVGTNLIDCVPQAGPCPNNCLECYYNKNFYVPIDTPLMPTLDEAEGKYVRVCSGNDANNHRNYVIEATEGYKDRYFNTSVPRFDFPGPVIFTCNPKDDEFIEAYNVDNVMAVRVRTSAWNPLVVAGAVEYYTSRNVPVILTFMRYTDPANVKKPGLYIENVKHILASYWTIRPWYFYGVMKRYEDNPLVFSCGTPESSFCRDCGNCERLYRRAKYQIE